MASTIPYSSRELRRPPKKEPPKCSHCGTSAKLVSGRALYSHRIDLRSKLFWKCPVCPDSHCGCHPNSDVPLGTPADAITRGHRILVHQKLDPLWMLPGLSWTKRRAKRKAVYKKLAETMGIPVDSCHTALFDVSTCKNAIRAMDSWGPA